MTDELKTRDVHPFKNWCDWYNKEKQCVITFVTMANELYREWNNQCVSIKHSDCDHDTETLDGVNEYINCDESERVVEHSNFNPEKIREPGIHRDREGEELYTIVVPHSFMTYEICEAYVQKLNEKYDRDYTLVLEEWQTEETSDVDGAKGIVLNPEEEEDDDA